MRYPKVQRLQYIGFQRLDESCPHFCFRVNLERTKMSFSQHSSAAVAEPATKQDSKRKQQPKYNVILWDDSEHTYEYVITMMQRLFGHSYLSGLRIAKEVDHSGKAVCLTTTLEHAELKRDQIRAFGRDKFSRISRGSMSASIEPAS